MYLVTSNVAREGLNPSNRHTQYAKYPIFSTFETDFCTKSENSSPYWHWQWECDCFGFRLEENSVAKNLSQPMWRPFFGLHLISGTKPSKCKLFQFDFTPPKQSPPIANSWLRACLWLFLSRVINPISVFTLCQYLNLSQTFSQIL